MAVGPPPNGRYHGTDVRRSTKRAEVREGAHGDDDIQARSPPTQAGCERARGNDNKAPSPQRDSTMIFVNPLTWIGAIGN